MRILSFTTECPECGEVINVEEYEFYIYEDLLYVAFECPSCHIDIDNEYVYT